MFQFEANDTVIVQQRKVLEAALSTNPKTQKALQQLINDVLKEARQEAITNVRSSLGSDPRGASYGIRRTVYKKMLGGDLNIYNMRRKAGKPTTYEPPKKLKPHQRGGNRVPRGRRTQQVMSYGPHDRGWILRIVNSGTANRTAGTRNGKLWGNRGSISARNFFRTAAEPTLMRAADRLAQLIDSEIQKMLSESSSG